jgi:general secretion pathway protein J
MKRTSRAFTLIELLVALAVFAVIAVLSLRALSASIDHRAYLEQEGRKWRDLGALFGALQNDLSAVLTSPGLSLVGAATPAEPDGFWLAFARAGRGEEDESAIAPYGVRYRLAADHVERSTYFALAAPGSEPAFARSRFPPQVRSLQVRYLGEDGVWAAAWSSVDGSLPRAIDLGVELISGERVRRVFMVR